MRVRGAIDGFGKFRQILTLFCRVWAFMMDFEMFPSWSVVLRSFLVGSRAVHMHLCGAAGASSFGICPTRARAMLTCNIIADAPQSYLRADIARRYTASCFSPSAGWGVPEFRMAAIGNFEAVISTCV